MRRIRTAVSVRSRNGYPSADWERMVEMVEFGQGKGAALKRGQRKGRGTHSMVP